MMAQVLGFLTHGGRPGLNSQLLVPAQSKLTHGGLLGGEKKQKQISVSHLN